MTPIRVPGVGEIIAGLDWIELPGVDSHSEEMRQMARRVSAQWQYEWPLADKAKRIASFVPQGLAKTAPVAAAALVHAAIPDEPTRITLIDLQTISEDDEPDTELKYWVFATVNGAPAKRMDFVGNAQNIRTYILEFVSSLDDKEGVPVYTDLGELLETMSYRFDVRPFSLEILRHSLTKKDYSNAKFSRYRRVSMKVTAFLVLSSLAAVGYLLTQDEIEQMQRRDAAQARQREIERKTAELAKAVDAGINAALPAATALPAYLLALQDLPLLLNGWKLQDIDCKASACMLSYKSQPLATWRGYLLAKPGNWPAPTFANDISAVIQELPVEMAPALQRTPADLPTRESARYAMGNVAQVIAPVGLTLSMHSSWARVAAQGQQQDGLSIPMRADFTVSGAAVLIEDMAFKLPTSAGITSIQIKLDEKSTFEVKGEVYARP